MMQEGYLSSPLKGNSPGGGGTFYCVIPISFTHPTQKKEQRLYPIIPDSAPIEGNGKEFMQKCPFPSSLISVAASWAARPFHL